MERQNLVLGVALGAAITLPGGGAFAGVIITVEEVGGDVVFSGGGTLDTSLWTFFSNAPLQPWVDTTEFAVVGAATNADIYASPVNLAGPAGIGPGGFTAADSGVGDLFGLDWGEGGLAVPTGYLSGGPLGPSTATYAGHTFASLGVEVGSYTWTWDTDTGQSDFFTINVIPAPGACALLGVAGLVCRRRRSG